MWRKLAEIEFLKISRYSSVRVILILHFSLFLLALLVASRIDFSVPGFNTNRLYRFPGIWTSVTWLASWFNLLLGIMVILLIGNEFTFRTFRQSLVNGLSRSELVNSKILTVLLFSLYGLVLALVSGLIFGIIGSINHGYDGMFDGFGNLLLYFLQTFAYMSFALLVTVLFQGTAISIVMFLLYRILAEPILRLIFEVKARQFFPMKSIVNLTPNYYDMLNVAGVSSADMDITELQKLTYQAPNWQNAAMVVFYTVLFLGFSYWLMKRKNL